MFLDSYWQKCPCGHGPGWYCKSFPGGRDSSHEYNPHADPGIATGKAYYTRRAPAVVFGHISGSHAEAHLCEYGPGELSRVRFVKQKFIYKKYGSRQAAFDAALRWVEQAVGQDLFLSRGPAS